MNKLLIRKFFVYVAQNAVFLLVQVDEKPGQGKKTAVYRFCFSEIFNDVYSGLKNTPAEVFNPLQGCWISAFGAIYESSLQVGANFYFIIPLYSFFTFS